MTTWDDVSTLGIWLWFKLDHVTRLRNENNSVRGAALKILGSFYEMSGKPEAKKWRMINEALRELSKDSTIERLGLSRLQFLSEENQSAGSQGGYSAQF